MTLSASWEDVERIFHRILKVPPGDRPAALKSECQGNKALLEELESLLEVSYEAGHFLDKEALDDGMRILAKDAEDRSGEILGRYRLTRHIGRGGTGVVYRGEPVATEDRGWVAIKLLLSGSRSAPTRARFRRERLILENLQHPGIARFYEGGATPEGHPYLVMEGVEGAPIDQYCASRGLSIQDTLHLFLQVCGAVSYAHQQLVIHRDLKPTNILVTDQGVVKLLDFGTAKLLESDGLAETAPLTAAIGRMLTPGYASPEQMEGSSITTAADVFGLGVVLYELLTKVHPFLTGNDSFQEAYRRVSAFDPVAPSESIESSKRARALAGDLDAIVLRALRKEPESRYLSVERLAADLRAHLEFRPVTARRGTLRYRCRRFLKRHWPWVAAQAAVLSIIVAASVFLLDQQVDLAKEKAKAEATAQFLIELFQVADPDESRAATLTADQILQRGADRVDTDFADQPNLRASLLGTIGEAYLSLGHRQQGCRFLFEAHGDSEGQASDLAPSGLSMTMEDCLLGEHKDRWNARRN